MDHRTKIYYLNIQHKTKLAECSTLGKDALDLTVSVTEIARGQDLDTKLNERRHFWTMVMKRSM